MYPLLIIIIPFFICSIFSQLSHSMSSPLSTSSANESKLVLESTANDSIALLSFKSLISNDPFGALSSWNHTVHHCQWRGVTCSRRRHSERVIALVLVSLNLTGNLSPHLTNLTFLRILNLTDNNLGGRIPHELFYRLRRLRYLNLAYNSFNSEIPNSFSNCRELQTIRLGFNSLVGVVPWELSSLKNLRILSLTNNYLHGNIPPFLGNLSALTGVDLHGNSFVAEIPHTLCRLNNLAFFGVQSNRLTGQIPLCLFNLSFLSTFNVGNNKLSGSLPNSLGLALPNLERFSIFFNNIEGPIPESLGNSSLLKVIALNGNKLSGPVPPNWGNFKNLNLINIANNQLAATSAGDWEFISSLANCTKLQTLHLSHNRFGGLLPKSLFNLSTHITWLAIGWNLVSGKIPAEIGRFTSLGTLRMEQNLLSGPIPDTIGNLQHLYELDFSGNIFYDKLPSSLGNLSQLNKLDLSLNKLQGTIPSNFGYLQNIQVLDLSYNQLTGSIPSSLVGLSSLSMYLNLSHNSFAGYLPADISKLKNVQVLDLSENKLSGEIPGAIGNCEILQYLYLQGNRFEGELPGSLINLKGVTELDLSRNNLSAGIPESFANFQHLQLLNLSFNHLRGPVPVNGPFSNLATFSVLGNDNLCGGILGLGLKRCTSDTIHEKGHHSIQLIVTVSVISAILALVIIVTVLICNRKKSKSSLEDLSYIYGHKRLSYYELFKATEGFSSSNLIGSGSFGSVYKGVMDFEPKIVAVKVLDLHHSQAFKSFAAECKALKGIRHLNLVKVHSACSGEDSRRNPFKALVLEFMVNESLESWLHPGGDASRKLSLMQRLNIALDVASALDYLHHHHGPEPIIHCDIKPSNVLLDGDMVAHVSDFGLARFLSNSSSGYVRADEITSSIAVKGSIGYIAPEYGSGGRVRKEGDVYSYGILLLEMFTGRRPSDGMFSASYNLYSHVSSAYPDNLMEVIDSSMIDKDEDEDEEKGHQCLISIIRVGLLCANESPKERMNMGEVVNEMIAIRRILFGK